MGLRRRGATMAASLMTVVVVFGACGDDKKDKESSSPTTAASTTTTLSQIQLDKAKAQRILLTAADLPGYTLSPPDPSSANSAQFDAAADACVNRNAILAALGEDNDPRGAYTEDFEKGDSLTVSSAATLAETEDQARTAVADASVATVPACLARAITAELKTDATLTNVTVTGSKLPTLTVGDQNVGFRMVAKARTQGQNVTFNTDFTFLRVGRALALLTDSSVTTVLPEAERVRLATVLTGRMAGP